MRLSPCAILIALLLVPLLPAETRAWGDLGHTIICEVAFRELNADARERVEALIRRDPGFARFADACRWPDQPRQRDAEHFVNLPRDAAGLGADPCPLAEVCVITAIAADLAVLASPTAGEHERLEALKFLGHWVGDLHQPLHVGFRDDRGGNAIRVAGGLCNGTLHAVWDSCLVEHVLGREPRAAADRLVAEITDAQRPAWLAADVADWANESFALATNPEVGYCVRHEDGCWYAADTERWAPGEPEKIVMIDAAYLEVHAATVRDRLASAGVRLAGLLNAALGR